MKRRQQGRYVEVAAAGERVRGFVPVPLPPKPPIHWTPSLRARFDAALLALGRLDAVTDLLPNATLVLYSFVRKEAVLSSMIEGTQSSLADLLLWEIDEQPGVPVDDAREVSRYVKALEHGLKRLRGGFPLSLRLIREVHEALMRSGRGGHLTPGEFRRSQVWVGGTRPGNAAFVPPPPSELADCLLLLERFLHDHPEPTPPLLRAALAHVQFETIHPFLDGNGRVGRLLIALQLAADGLLREPLLYFSLHFKAHRSHYYDLLNGVRERGDWEAWLEFFAEAVEISATQAAAAARRLLDLATADAIRIERLGRPSASGLAVHRALQKHPISTAASLAAATGLSAATVNKTLLHLRKLRIVSELTNRKRGRVFSYTRYIGILNEGMPAADPERG
jgi:Fic family protein